MRKKQAPVKLYHHKPDKSVIITEFDTKRMAARAIAWWCVTNAGHGPQMANQVRRQAENGDLIIQSDHRFQIMEAKS